MNITDHAKSRIKERLGLPKRAIKRHVDNVFNVGYKHGVFSGRVKRYLDGQFLKYRSATNMRVFSGYLYIFSKDTLITVYELPKKYKSLIKSIQG